MRRELEALPSGRPGHNPRRLEVSIWQQGLAVVSHLTLTIPLEYTPSQSRDPSPSLASPPYMPHSQQREIFELMHNI